MIETVAIPILLKAVDFLFNEVGKIIQGQRERRKAENELNGNDSVESEDGPIELDNTKPQEDVTAQMTDRATESNIIQSKAVALNTPIDEAAWKDSKAEVEHLLSLLEIYKKNYYLAKSQYAKFGSALVPPIILHNLEEAEEGIVATTEKLLVILGRVYGKEIVIPQR